MPPVVDDGELTDCERIYADHDERLLAKVVVEFADEPRLPSF